MQPRACAPAFSRRASRPSFRMHRPRIVKRAQGRPGAGRTHGPPAAKNAGGSHHRFSQSSGLPCAMVLRLIRDLPGDRAFLPPSSARCEASSPTWRQRRGARTTRLHRPQLRRSSAQILRPARLRPSHPALTCRDDRDTSLFIEAGYGLYKSASSKSRSDLFLLRRLDRNSRRDVICPTRLGKNSAFWGFAVRFCL
jgi:hypothetical protein